MGSSQTRKGGDFFAEPPSRPFLLPSRSRFVVVGDDAAPLSLRLAAFGVRTRRVGERRGEPRGARGVEFPSRGGGSEVFLGEGVFTSIAVSWFTVWGGDRLSTCAVRSSSCFFISTSCWSRARFCFCSSSLVSSGSVAVLVLVFLLLFFSLFFFGLRCRFASGLALSGVSGSALLLFLFLLLKRCPGWAWLAITGFPLITHGSSGTSWRVVTLTHQVFPVLCTACAVQFKPCWFKAATKSVGLVAFGTPRMRSDFWSASPASPCICAQARRSWSVSVMTRPYDLGDAITLPWYSNAASRASLRECSGFSHTTLSREAACGLMRTPSIPDARQRSVSGCTCTNRRVSRRVFLQSRAAVTEVATMLACVSHLRAVCVGDFCQVGWSLASRVTSSTALIICGVAPRLVDLRMCWGGVREIAYTYMVRAT